MSDPTTAAELCRELGIAIVPTKVRRSRLGELECCCELTIENMIAKHGVEHVRFVLISICETRNNRRELVAPVLEAVSDIILHHPDFTTRPWSSADGEPRGWLDLLDEIDIPALREIAKQNRRVASVREGLGALIHYQIVVKTHVKGLV